MDIQKITNSASLDKNHIESISIHENNFKEQTDKVNAIAKKGIVLDANIEDSELFQTTFEKLYQNNSSIDESFLYLQNYVKSQIPKNESKNEVFAGEISQFFVKDIDDKYQKIVNLAGKQLKTIGNNPASLDSKEKIYSLIEIIHDEKRSINKTFNFWVRLAMIIASPFQFIEMHFKVNDATNKYNELEERLINLISLNPNNLVRKKSSKIQQALDITKEGKKYQAASEFIKCYNEKLKGLDHLKLDAEALGEKILEMINLDTDLDFKNFLIDDNLSMYLEIINQKIIDGKFKENKEFLKQMINDIILFACIEPHKTIVNKHRMERSSIEVLNTNLLNDMLCSLSLQQQIDFSKNQYLNHLYEDEYNKFSLVQKIVFINLANFDPDTRIELMKDKIFQVMFERKDLQQWMMACSGSLEQNYLNTCSSTVFCQGLISRMAMLPEALFFTKVIIKKIEDDIKKDSKIIKENGLKEYVQERLIDSEKSVEKLNERLLQLLQSDEEISFEAMHELTLEWGRITQKLGLLLWPEDAVHPTTKPIKDQWFISLIVMIPIVLLEHLFRLSNNPPRISLRVNGVWEEGYDRALQKKINQFTAEPENFVEAREEEIKTQMNQVEEKDRLKAIDDFWILVHNKEGVAYAYLGHKIYYKAIYYENKKLFLIGDPMHHDYQVKTPEQMLIHMQKSDLQLLISAILGL